MRFLPLLSPLYRIAILGLAMADLSALAAETKVPFQFQEGDRVLLIGDTLIEREPEYGALEAALTLATGGKSVIFRNVGWSADTPAGESRTSLSPHTQGPECLREDIALVKPTVAIIGYGMASSFEGEGGVARFQAELLQLTAFLNEQAPGGAARLIFLSPLSHEALGGAWPDPAVHNRDLQRYSDAVATVARQSGGWYVPLFSKLRSTTHPLTSNGIHLHAEGYAALARLVLQELGLADADQANTLTRDDPRLLLLRERIAEKNRLFFYRFRPHNSMFVAQQVSRLSPAERGQSAPQSWAWYTTRPFSEQKKNRREIPLFDPLVEAQDRQIAALLRPPLPSVAPPSDSEKKPEPAVPLSPAKLETLPELEITLFAKTPQLTKPIAMNFDAQGRLWVATSELYPQIAPGQTASDKIFVLEDRDGDGQAESGTVFAKNLLIPTGIEPDHGGVYVGHGAELRFLKDTNGDGVADEQRVVLSGFGTEDSHQNIHTLRWGPDGCLYFNQSIYIQSHIETPHGTVRRGSGGIFRFDPRTERLSVLAHGLINPWGHAFDLFGQSFATDGAGSGGINYVLPGATYVGYKNLRRRMNSISPGSYPKFAGLEFIRGGHFPAEWDGQLVTADFRANTIMRFAVREDGAGFAAESLGKLVWSTDRSFRPVDVKVGPDGALYIADWSNPVIQHVEVDFRDPKRDKITGHIWRLAYKGRALCRPAPPIDAPVADLLAQLLHPNDVQRRGARRLLAERGPAVLPAAKTWAETQNTDEARLEALWLSVATDQIDRPLLDAVLRASDGRVRTAAIRLVVQEAELPEGSLSLLERSLADEHPRVRLEALRGLGRIHDLRAVDFAFAMLRPSSDKLIEYAVWLTLNDLMETWTRAVEENRWKIDGRGPELAYGIKAIAPLFGERILRHTLREVTWAPDGSGPWIDLIGSVGGPELQQSLFERVLRREFDDVGAERALAALLDSALHRNVQPAGEKTGLLHLPYATDAVQSQVAKLAGAWKLPEASSALLTLAAATDRSPPLRQAALEGLRRLGAPKTIESLRALATRREPAIWRNVVFTLLALDATQGAPLFLDWMAANRAMDEAIEGWRELFQLRGAVSAVVSELAQRTLPDLPAEAGRRVAREQSAKGQELGDRLARESLVASTPANVGLRLEDIPKLVANLKKGDPVRGERIYRRADLACTACHALGGVGGKVGPDLATIGTGASAEYIVESIVAPSVKVKDGYQALVLRTADREISGVVEREDADRIFLRDGAGQEVAVPKSSIQAKQPLGSMMPSGLIDRLPPQDQLDLLRFLTELGKPPFDVSARDVARTWEAFSIKPEFTSTESTEWLQRTGQPVYGALDGALRPEDLTTAGLEFPLVLTTRFYCAADGVAKITLRGNAAPTHIWIDTRSLALTTMQEGFPVSAGEHRLVLRFDVLAGAMTVKSDDVTFIAR